MSVKWLISTPYSGQDDSSVGVGLRSQVKLMMMMGVKGLDRMKMQMGGIMTNEEEGEVAGSRAHG